MKIHEIREMKTEELLKTIAEEERNMLDLRFSHQLKQLTNTAKLSLVKKDLARLKTVLRERQAENAEAVVKEENKEGASA